MATLLLVALAFAGAGREARAQPTNPLPVEDAPAVEPPPAPPEPEAPPPGGRRSVEVELAGQAAYVTAPIRGGTNPFGAGFGGRVGLDLGGLYVGVSVVDFLGGRDVDVSYRALLYGGEIGYGFRIPAFARAFWLLRPRVGVGNAAVYYTDPSLAVDVVTTASGRSASDTLTVNNLYVQPGFTWELSTPSYFAAIDASVLVLPGIAYGGADATTWVSYGAQGQVGVRF